MRQRKLVVAELSFVYYFVEYFIGCIYGILAKILGNLLIYLWLKDKVLVYHIAVDFPVSRVSSIPFTMAFSEVSSSPGKHTRE